MLTPTLKETYALLKQAGWEQDEIPTLLTKGQVVRNLTFQLRMACVPPAHTAQLACIFSLPSALKEHLQERVFRYANKRKRMNGSFGNAGNGVGVCATLWELPEKYLAADLAQDVTSASETIFFACKIFCGVWEAVAEREENIDEILQLGFRAPHGFA